MPECTGAQLGKLFDLTERRIQQLVTAGAIVRVGRGKYDLWPSIQGYMQYLKDLAVTDEKKLVKENLRLKEIQRKKIEGELIDAKEMEAGLVKKFSSIRNRIRVIPTKCAQEIYDLKKAKKKKIEVVTAIQKILMIECDDALSELAEHGENEEKVKPEKSPKKVKRAVKKKVVKKAVKKKKVKSKK